ncbi:MAG: hypothetical protein AB7H81_05305 [Vicinamibacterales bacterium]
MSSLTDIEKRYVEKVLGMGGGYVLDFTDATFDTFFKRHKRDIHHGPYQKYGTSKAKKLRAFWEVEPDAVVGSVLSELLDAYEADCDLNKREIDSAALTKTRAIVARLQGRAAPPPPEQSAAEFLSRHFAAPNVQKLPIEQQVVPIIESRLAEADKALAAGAHLSVIFLCGSVLEAVLLGAAQKEPARFNKASASPRNQDASVRKFHEWTLAQFIDVACEIGILKPDVKKFGHGLREFRNYIHPYEQMVSGFTPDHHTATLCVHVLKAALASVAGER